VQQQPETVPQMAMTLEQPYQYQEQDVLELTKEWMLWLYWPHPTPNHSEPGSMDDYDNIVTEVEIRVLQLGDSRDRLDKLERWLTDYFEANPQVPHAGIHPALEANPSCELSLNQRIFQAYRNLGAAMSVPLVAGWADFL
jgi:hypothetical protein